MDLVKQLRYLPAVEWKKVFLSKRFSKSESESLSFSRVWVIPLPVKGFWEFLNFFDLFLFYLILFIYYSLLVLWIDMMRSLISVGFKKSLMYLNVKWMKLLMFYKVN